VVNTIGLLDLWIFYALAYAIAFPLQLWANKKRGAPFDDPEFLYGTRGIFPLAIVWLLSGLVISLFVPLRFGALFYIGLAPFIFGLVVVGLTFRSFALNPGLATSGIHRHSRNPGYVGWAIVFIGLGLMGWSRSPWSIAFAAYVVLTFAYFHWTVLLEEKFLVGKYGDSYREYIAHSRRYFGRR